ncbi:MAG: aminotransferase class V-fold PLP-dependent enzyme [Gemmataceae bacterium]|nr:aminotransferase class V-fold PLP-dependent enzyme [Gemmataceae bacterium]
MNSTIRTTDVAHPDWSAARAAMMLDPQITNLNTGSFGPTPRPVFDRVTELRERQAAAPMNFLVRETPDLLWRARTRLAEFVGVDPTRLVFTQNVSTAVNIIASGLRLPPGELLMSDREYGAMQWCWERAAERQGVAIRTFRLPLAPDSPDEIVDAFASAITPEVRVAFFSHVYSANGMFVPAAAMCRVARERGVISVVDGAHSPAIVPLDIDRLGCDFYAANCHKWLLAPLGAGFLAIGKNMVDRLNPLQVSWGYYTSGEPDARDEFGTTPRTRRLEFEGTRDVCPWLVVPEAIDFQARLGWPGIHARQRELATLVRRLGSCWEPASPADPTLHGPMTAFVVSGKVPAEEVRRRLWADRVEIPITDWSDVRIARFSTHFYTTESEIERGVNSLKRALA